MCIIKTLLRRKGKNWIQNFHFVRCFATPNRRLLNKKLIFDFVRPFDLIPKYAEKCERSPTAGGASEQTNCPQNSQRLDWSQLLNAVRTFFERQFLS
ncbi:MAG TPA: hypothetical protein ENM99_02715 [Desulfurella acetivorans]|uniref:Uncharacterized protein n=1 Tax=Desulfurella acetivorans TaxID=33002 RepID=A0A7C6A7I8_DESAE|nr:hypothetical protein [Desulfurella acetivorans]